MLKGVTVGCGYFSRIQMEGWQRVTGAQISAACDLDRAKAEQFARDFNLRPYTDVEDMLDREKPDFVDIATRPTTHLPLVEQAARRKIPVLCQKPMAETWEQACRIADVSRQSGIRLMMNENWRWQAWYRKIKTLIAEGRIGKPFFYHFATRQRDGLGDKPYPNQPYFVEMPRLLVFETIVHHIDTARFLLGDIDEVYCRTAKLNPVIAGEDLALIMLRHGNGVHGVIDGNRATEPDEEGPALETSRFEGLDAAIRLRRGGEVWLGQEKVFSAAGLPGYRGDSCRATQQHFVDCLAGGGEFETEAADYVKRTVAVVEACYRSAAENRPLKVEELAGKVEAAALR